MQLSLPVRVVIVLFATLSVFWLPWTITLFCIFLAGLAFPPAALAIGILADLVYYPGHGLMWGTIDGIVLALFAAAVRHFVKTRIM